jgi:hypothetical protein
MTRLANLILTAALVAATSACRSENTAAAAPQALKVSSVRAVRALISSATKEQAHGKR